VIIPDLLGVVEDLLLRHACAREIVVLVLRRLGLAIVMALSEQWQPSVQAKPKSEQPEQSFEKWHVCDCDDVNASLQSLQQPGLLSLVERPMSSDRVRYRS
jgi:hypothetical protein